MKNRDIFSGDEFSFVSNWLNYSFRKNEFYGNGCQEYFSLLWKCHKIIEDSPGLRSDKFTIENLRIGDLNDQGEDNRIVRTLRLCGIEDQTELSIKIIFNVLKYCE